MKNLENKIITDMWQDLSKNSNKYFYFSHFIYTIKQIRQLSLAYFGCLFVVFLIINNIKCDVEVTIVYRLQI